MNQSQISDSAGCPGAQVVPPISSSVAERFISQRPSVMKKFQRSGAAVGRPFAKMSAALSSCAARTVSLRTLLFAAACVAFGFCLGSHWRSSGDATFGRLPLVAEAPFSAPQSTLAAATQSPRLPAEGGSGWTDAQRAEVFGSLPAAEGSGTGPIDRQGLVVVVSDSTASL